MGSDGPSPSPDSPEHSATYAALAETLSQGDIVAGIPPAILDNPLTICRPDSKPGRSWHAPAEECKNPAAWAKQPLERIHAASRRPGLGMVIWEDCQVDKMRSQGADEHKWFVGVAPVFSFDELGVAGRPAVREGRRMAFFPLPAMPSVGIATESYVDLRFIVPVRYTMLSERLTTLSPTAKAALHHHFFKFLTAKTFAERIACPSCATEIAPDAALVDLHEN